MAHLALANLPLQRTPVTGDSIYMDGQDMQDRSLKPLDLTITTK